MSTGREHLFGNRGGRKGRSGRPKGPVNERERAQRRAAARARKGTICIPGQLKREVREALKIQAAEWCKGRAIALLIAIAETGEKDADRVRAIGEMLDRFGAVRRTESTMRMEGAMPVIEFRDVAIEAPEQLITQ